MSHPVIPFRALARAVIAVSISATTVPAPGAPTELPPSAGLRLASVSTGVLPQAPALSTEVRIEITGVISRTRVRQRFRNPTAEWVEGVYVFPLPDRAAVNRMRIFIGDRVVEGRIRERETAKREYEAAKLAGKKTSILEQQRPNLFTAAVANLGPGEVVEVEIGYQETVTYRDGEFRLRFPMVVGPRYIPGSASTPATESTPPTPVSGGLGWSLDTDQVGDASAITPPVPPPGRKPDNPVGLQVVIHAGIPLAAVNSLYHRVVTETNPAGATLVTLGDGPVPAERDFVLAWRPEVGSAPRAAVFSERHEGRTYSLLMVIPPQPRPESEAEYEPISRETIFVIDTSGSMGGGSIRQARQALRLAVGQLHEGDYFNIIQFNSRTHRLFASSLPVNGVTRAAALAYVNALAARGGTEMAPALGAALESGHAPTNLRQVVFLTDGAVGNESALFRLIRNRIGESRLFTVGIGSAPNSHFMRNAARHGRGTYTYIGDPREVRDRMEKLFAVLGQPRMSDLVVKWPASSGPVEGWPSRIPDLYAGEPVVVVARMLGAPAEVTVTGTRAGTAWKETLSLRPPGTSAGIARLWGRRKIAALMDSRVEGAEEAAVRGAVVEVALEHGLASRYTSFVAVDVTPARTGGAKLHRTAVPNRLPNGWDHEKVFGRLPQTATPAGLQILVGAIALASGLLGLALRRRWREQTHAENPH